jgi:hypothetical protein
MLDLSEIGGRDRAPLIPHLHIDLHLIHAAALSRELDP